MKKNALYLAPLSIFLIFVVFLNAFFGIYRASDKLSLDNNQAVSVYQSEENKNAVVFAVPSNSKNASVSFSKALKNSGVDVYLLPLKLESKDFYSTFSSLVSKINETKSYSKLGLIGYDFGGYEGLNFINKSPSSFDGAVFISPFYEIFDETAVSVKGGSYVLNVPWVMELSPNSFSAPTLILSSVSDEYCPPSLSAQLYNHLSGDDIQRSVSSFGAKKGSVALSVETGILHGFAPHSDKLFSKTISFLGDSVGMDIAKSQSHLQAKSILWVLLGVSLILSLLCASVGAYKSFTDITETIFISNSKKAIMLFGFKLLSIVLSAVLIGLSYIPLKNVFSLPLSFYFSAFLALGGGITIFLIYKFILPKGAPFLKSIKMLSKSRNYHLSALVIAIDLLAYLSFIVTGFSHNYLSLQAIPTYLLIFGFSLIFIFSFIYETELIRSLTKTKFIGTIYGVALTIPFVLVFIFSAVKTSFALSFESIMLAGIYLVAVLSSLIMREIGASRWFYTLSSSAILSLCLISLV